MIPSLLKALGAVPDHRAPNSIHPLASILAMAVCAMLCGATSVLAISQWGRRHGKRVAKALKFRRPYTPCNTSFHYVFRALDALAFEKAVTSWLAGVAPNEVHAELEAVVGKQAVAIDGKTLCGSSEGPDVPAVALVAAFLHNGGQVLEQEAVVGGDELETVRTVLKRMPLENRIVTGDALQTQRDISAMIVGKKKRLHVHRQGEPTHAPG